MNINYLKVDELKDGYLYRIHARNARIGIWRAEQGDFVISRTKFTDNYLFEEIHWDLDNHFGTVKPIKELGDTPFDLKDFIRCDFEYKGRKAWGYPKNDEILAYLNKKNGELDDGNPS